MSETQDQVLSTQTSPAPADAGAAPTAPRRAFRPTVVLKLLGLIVALGAIILVCFGFFDGARWLHGLTVPPLVPATGRVLYNGEPLAGAQISTLPVGRKIRGAIGWTDDDGKFSLQTDLNGYAPGAYACEHQVVVTLFKTMNAPMQPPLLTPEVYSKFATTPLRISIARSGSENSFTLNLEGDPLQSRFGNEGGRPPMSPPPINQQAPEGDKDAPATSVPE